MTHARCALAGLWLVWAIAGCGDSAATSPQSGAGGDSAGSGAGTATTSSTGGAGSAGMGGASAGGLDTGGTRGAAGAGAGGAGNAGSAGAGGSAGTDGGGGLGGGGSSGTNDAGGGDAGDAGSTSSSGGCEGSAYLLCEDFDTTDPGAIPSGWEKHGDPVSVVVDDAASGNHALELGPIDNGERRIYHDASALPSTHWGRIRYRVRLPVPDAFVHSTIVTLRGRSPKPDNANLEVRVVDTVKESKDGFNGDGNGSRHQFLYNVQPDTRGEFGTGSSYDWMFDASWHCAEWYVDSAQQAYRFFFDGEEIDDIAIMNGAGNYDDSEIPTSFSEIRVGWNNYQSAPPGFTAWVDDFAVHSERIGCN